VALDASDLFDDLSFLTLFVFVLLSSGGSGCAWNLGSIKLGLSLDLDEKALLGFLGAMVIVIKSVGGV
jgi:hypothetical protein